MKQLAFSLPIQSEVEFMAFHLYHDSMYVNELVFDWPIFKWELCHHFLQSVIKLDELCQGRL